MTAELFDQPLQKMCVLQWREADFPVHLPHVPRHVAYQQSCLINPCKRCVSYNGRSQTPLYILLMCLGMLHKGRAV